MKVGRVIAGGLLILLAAVVVFTALGAPLSVLTTMVVWSPVLLCVAGVVVLLTAVTPRRVVVIGLTLLLIGGLGLAASHRLVDAVVWWSGLTAVLVLGGLFLIMSGLRGPAADRRPGAPLVCRRLFRNEPALTVPTGTVAIAATVWWADVVLDLPYVSRKVPVEVDATVMFGHLTVRVPDEVPEKRIVRHDAFVMTRRELKANRLQVREPEEPTPLLTVVAVGVGGTVKVFRTPRDQIAAVGQSSATVP